MKLSSNIQRLHYVDVAKAVCIILVVVGHYNPTSCPEWWNYLFAFIYSFHMPAFMFLSGLLFAETSRKHKYGDILLRKAKRLFLPYVSASVTIICIKLLAQTVLEIKNKVDPYALIEMFWTPSAAIHLWFIWALLIIFIIIAACNSECWYWIVLVVSASVWIAGIRLPEIFCLNNVPRMMVFFICGLLWKLHGSPLPNVWLVLLSFAAVETVYFITDSKMVYDYILPFLGIASVVAVSQFIERNAHPIFRNVFIGLGESSFFIYLFHTTCSELVKSILSTAGITTANSFVLCLLICVLAGILIPLLINRLVIRNNRILALLFGN